MKAIPPECQEDNSNPKIPIEEHKSKITFLNPDRITVIKIKVDGCVIKKDDPALRCDYVLIPRDDIEIYIELKGHAINHAVDQIKSTIKKLSGNPTKLRKLCFIISTRVPKQGTDIQKLQVQFKKEFNASFRVKNTPDTYNLRDLSL
jgi:hypothetical protein